MSKADPFAVWGSPSKAVLNGLTVSQASQLRIYVERITGRAYTIGFDCGVDHALNLVNETTQARLSEQRSRRR